ncbi:hypothetical protein N7478_006349 [Penicillium angulare]|uniref:uncharacterized protein n=1 Tax=Penicillium angulare TaxID=116970 RepID=UPI0025421493|nr:uncharacterized protein N7478_006349 [Penicillium angulare]KAJ5280977.1 hypothetical protein N7478_006349 [Penicillium angulare]
MADNLPIDVIRSHQEDQESIASSTHNRSNSQSQTTRPEANDDAEEKYKHDVPPDGGYGWVCIACVFWINAHTWGINSSYGVFLSYYLSHDVFPGANSLSYAFTGGLSISCALLVAPLATYLIHLYGIRLVLNLGVFFETLSLVGSSFATQKWHIFLSQGVCFGWGMGFLFVGSVGIAPQWFQKRRGVAMGITASGSGLGGLMYSLAVGAIIPRYGLGWAFRILGIISCVVNVVCANLLRDRNKLVGSRFSPFHAPLLRKPEFILFLGWGFFSMLGYVALLFSVANFALSVGLSAHQGSVVSALLNLGQGLGRPFVGMFSDTFGRINIATFLSFICGLFCLVIWVFADSMGVVCFFAVLVGTVSGTYWATVSPVLVEIIGLRDLPSGLSINWLWLVAPCTVSEAIALELRRPTSSGGTSYLHVQLFTGFMYVAGSICLWIVRGWKIGELQRAEQKQQSAVRREPLTGTGDDRQKEGSPAAFPATLQSGEDMQTSSVWTPFNLTRQMFALERV